MSSNLVLYAPNVHVGGGFVLLQSLLATGHKSMIVFLDYRIKDRLTLPSELNVFWVAPTAIARLKGEILLYKRAELGDVVLCFHSLPPLLPSPAMVKVFFQNANILDFDGVAAARVHIRIRLLFERIVFRIFSYRVQRFYVQTPTMKALLVKKGKVDIDKITISPFGDVKQNSKFGLQVERKGFIYVADGSNHKNHSVLIAAWSLLAEQGHYPILKLTLGERDRLLWRNLKLLIDKWELKVENVGHLSTLEVEALYLSAEALIFPSLKESFGLPLIEASNVGLPIIASERDYVRDVCSPAETFDPLSPRSIARAVSRFKGWSKMFVDISSPKAFLQQVLCD